MTTFKAVHQCLFCPQVFDSAASKDDHILEHFAQEVCTDCNQNLIRIGSNLYTLHNAVTCIKDVDKSEDAIKPCTSNYTILPSKNRYEPKYEVNGEVDSKTNDDTNIFEEILIKVESDEENDEQRSEYIVMDMNQLPDTKSLKIDSDLENECQPKSTAMDINHAPDHKEIKSDLEPSNEAQSNVSQDKNRLETPFEQIQSNDHMNQRIVCDVCSQPFSSDLFLESHKKLLHSATSAANFNNNTHRMRPKNGKYSKEFECLICNKLYSSDLSLRTHVETIHDPGARKFKCKLCDMAFFRECALQSHHEQVHLNIKNFVCYTCGVGLKSKAALDRHIYRHTGEKPYKCLWEGCQKTFRCSSNREEHRRSHTGEKPFHCTIDGCDKKFTFAVDFRKHKFKVHNVFTNKFPCVVCSEVFPQNAMLKKHMIKHDIQM